MEGAPNSVVESGGENWRGLREQAAHDVEKLVPNLAELSFATYAELQVVAENVREELLKCTGDNAQRFYADRLAYVLHITENWLQVRELEESRPQEAANDQSYAIAA